jgi:hypothetical protein
LNADRNTETGSGFKRKQSRQVNKDALVRERGDAANKDEKPRRTTKTKGESSPTTDEKKSPRKVSKDSPRSDKKKDSPRSDKKKDSPQTDAKKPAKESPPADAKTDEPKMESKKEKQ